MKYKIGDKVRHDGGDWWLYGTVSAVFEHSISPCYRISVERMEKKRCNFSITQFEFEIEADAEAQKTGLGMLPAPAKDIEPALISAAVPAPEKKQRGRRKKTPILQQENPALIEKGDAARSKPVQVENPLKKKRGKRGEAWAKNLENFKKGEKNNVINAWVAQNRKEYRAGKLKEYKLDLLLGIDFPFEAASKKK